jgi:hypothetical protein
VPPTRFQTNRMNPRRTTFTSQRTSLHLNMSG